MSSEWFWAPIAWYREFCDVPRLLCVPIAGALLLLESPFSDALDDYEATYSVTLLEGDEAASSDEDALIARAAALQPLGQLAVSVEILDPTRRRAVRIPNVIGGVTLRPREQLVVTPAG